MVVLGVAAASGGMTSGTNSSELAPLGIASGGMYMCVLAARGECGIQCADDWRSDMESSCETVHA